MRARIDSASESCCIPNRALVGCARSFADAWHPVCGGLRGLAGAGASGGAGDFVAAAPPPSVSRRLGWSMADNSNGPGRELRETQGVVKWFDPRKGYGFIVGPEGQDIFAHFSAIEGDGFRVLKDGAPVLYDAVLTEKGWHATRVVRQDQPEIHVKRQRGYARTPRR